MKRYFNTEGSCNPNEHYMIRLDDRLDKIRRLFVDRGKYFIINRGRQYGKTTTLQALAGYLFDEYIVLALDFQTIGTKEFADASVFAKAFAGVLTSCGFDIRSYSGSDNRAAASSPLVRITV